MGISSCPKLLIGLSLQKFVQGCPACGQSAIESLLDLFLRTGKGDTAQRYPKKPDEGLEAAEKGSSSRALSLCTPSREEQVDFVRTYKL